ncbi:MAG: DNA polymerase III subunit beta [SAR86 cluster bacterium]|uniref:Beta sliding clamp n=1 Tax=SAR86 cluster bacterium TaxID=2030880 RepID=A0A520MYT7_9GAMM|nr:MAG: DNA polymerase III subunit beta [SAR86 cluster bacterium]
MDFYITKEEVVKSLNLTLGVVEKRQTLPILSNVLLEVDESSLKLTATDLESEISTTSTISNFKSGGKTTAPARKLSELCRLMPDLAEIHFFLDGDNLKIETESGKYNLSTLPSEDFPVFETEDTQSQINISSQNLKNLITKTSFAMGNQDWRHYLNGLYMMIDDKVMTTVATDAHRLAMATSSLNEASSESTSGIVPRKSINEIGKLVGDESENVVIQLGQTSIAANVSGTTFVSKLIEGKFPDYEQVIPSGESSLLVVDRKNFSESLSRVSVLSSEKYKGVRIITKKNSLNISANNPEKEQGEENLPCEYQGEEIDIAFNVNYLQEILSTIDSEKIEINFFGSEKSCLITDPNSENLKYVVMPLLI